MKLTLLAAASAAVLTFASPAFARLQLTITDGTNTFTCFDGQVTCDVNGGANNLLTVDTTVGGFFTEITLAQSSFGTTNILQLSSSNIVNNGAAEGTLTLLASDTNFIAPVTEIQNSGSLTFNTNVGAGLSTLKFWADPNNVQGADPLNTPGPLLESVSGTAATNPDSFSGSNLAAFSATSAFSMTEGASLDLLAGGSVTGFNQAMQTIAVPETSTWVMMTTGFGLLGLAALRRNKGRRFVL